jgi:hypothetical protein
VTAIAEDLGGSIILEGFLAGSHSAFYESNAAFFSSFIPSSLGGTMKEE